MLKEKNIIIINGSAKKDSSSSKIAKDIFTSAEIINLTELNIQYYNYDGYKVEDDFISIIEKMLKVDLVVFASPVYWYTVSAQLKTFLDRLTDLMYAHKPKGKALQGTKFAIISTYASSSGYMLDTLKSTLEYFKMQYTSHIVTKPKELTEDIISNFKQDVENSFQK